MSSFHSRRGRSLIGFPSAWLLNPRTPLLKVEHRRMGMARIVMRYPRRFPMSVSSMSNLQTFACVRTLAVLPPIPSRPTLSRRRGAILVVEDRDDVRQGLAQLLELHGYLVADAGTGEEGNRQLNADPDAVALILLDLMLPGRRQRPRPAGTAARRPPPGNHPDDRRHGL